MTQQGGITGEKFKKYGFYKSIFSHYALLCYQSPSINSIQR